MNVIPKYSTAKMNMNIISEEYSWIYFNIQLFATLRTIHCLKFLFHMDNHIDPVGNVIFMKLITRQIDTLEIIFTKGTWFV